MALILTFVISVLLLIILVILMTLNSKKMRQRQIPPLSKRMSDGFLFGSGFTFILIMVFALSRTRTITIEGVLQSIAWSIVVSIIVGFVFALFKAVPVDSSNNWIQARGAFSIVILIFIIFGIFIYSLTR